MNLDELVARPFAALPDLIREHAAENPGRTALVQEDRRLSYAELDAGMDRLAATLQREGLAPGDAVGICAATSIDYAIVFLGALRAGIAVAPLSPGSTADGLVTMLQDSEAEFVFLDAASAGILAPVRARFATRPVALDGYGAGPAFAEWLVPPGTRPEPVAIEPAWPFNIIYSSGTTGTPKGIVQPHAMRWAHVQRGTLSGYGPDAVTLVATPLYSNTTLVSFFPTLGLGGTVVLMGKFEAGRYLDLAQEHRATHTMLVPVQYQRLMAHPGFDRYDLSSFRMKFCTSAPFRAELKADVLERWPGGLVEYYGITEGGGTCILYAHETPDKLHTVGRPAPTSHIRLIDEAGREVAPGETGEVVGRSPGMMTGYHKQPEKTREAEWYDAEGRRHIRTGDLGRFDEDGFLVLMDRKKDMIISGGFNVYPSDLEAVLLSHPAVAEAAVVGVASERWGETPVAFFVPKPGAEAAPEALMAFVNERVGKTQRLAAVERVAALPRSSIGKILKRDLREGYRPKTPL